MNNITRTRYGIEVINCAGTTIYNVGLYCSKKEAFEAAKKSYKWFQRDPKIQQIKEITF